MCMRHARVLAMSHETLTPCVCLGPGFLGWPPRQTERVDAAAEVDENNEAYGNGGGVVNGWGFRVIVLLLSSSPLSLPVVGISGLSPSPIAHRSAYLDELNTGWEARGRGGPGARRSDDGRDLLWGVVSIPIPVPSPSRLPSPAPRQDADPRRLTRSGLGLVRASRHQISTTTFEALGRGRETRLESGKRSTVLRGAANGAPVALAKSEPCTAVRRVTEGEWWWGVVGGHVCATPWKDDDVAGVVSLDRCRQEGSSLLVGGTRSPGLVRMAPAAPVAGADCGG